MAENTITNVNNIITKDTLIGETPDNTGDNTVRDKLTQAGKVAVAGLIAGGAVASVLSGLNLVTGGVAAVALATLAAASTLADAGLKISKLMGQEREL